MFGLDELTSRTLGHPFGHIDLHPYPMIVLSEIMIHLGHSRMDRESRLVSFAKDLVF